jgi:CheY-like chemotaxis protein
MARVLVVDDDAAGLEIRRLILERRGYAVITAADAAQARAAFQLAEFDVVLLDVRLPRVEDGLVLIREFRAASPALRIVVLCGYRGDLDRRDEASMVDEILSKPARVETLLNALGGSCPLS